MRIRDAGCNLRAYRKRCYEHLRFFRGRTNFFVPIFLDKCGFKIRGVRVNHRARETGISKFGFKYKLMALQDLFLGKWNRKK